jgi:RNA-binding protein 39
LIERQANEAQRDDCTLLVYRLHLNAKERDLFNFFTVANIGKVVDIKVIRDPRTGRSKGAAYVEFESQESVLLAVAMSGQQVLGKCLILF